MVQVCEDVVEFSPVDVIGDFVCLLVPLLFGYEYSCADHSCLVLMPDD